AWRGKQGACVNAADSSADTSLCYYTLRVEP
ncbi:type IV pilus modification protein PilV, partial [Pseudomonas aeruginosa]